MNANLDFELIKIQTRMVIQCVSMMMNVSWVHQRATNRRNAGIHLEATSAIANTQMKHVAQKVFEVKILPDLKFTIFCHYFMMLHILIIYCNICMYRLSS